ncbi:hypothetical protein MASR2M36_37230 [Providencia sp.]
MDDFLLTRRLPLDKILVLLAIPFEHWQVPESQKYVLEVLSFFTQKLTSVTQRGNLVRMRLTQNTGRVDLMECGTPDRPANALLEHLLNRKKVRLLLTCSYNIGASIADYVSCNQILYYIKGIQVLMACILVSVLIIAHTAESS